VPGCRPERSAEARRAEDFDILQCARDALANTTVCRVRSFYAYYDYSYSYDGAGRFDIKTVTMYAR